MADCKSLVLPVTSPLGIVRKKQLAGGGGGGGVDYGGGHHTRGINLVALG